MISIKKSAAILIVFLCHHSEAQSIFGKIKDKETHQPIQYAHISVRDAITGTISNSDGAFSLTIGKIGDLDSLRISHVGYATATVCRKDLKENEENILSLIPIAVSLNEVVIRGKDPFDYFLDAVALNKSKIEYPFSTSAYFREMVKDNDECSKYSDALLTINYLENKEDMIVGVDQARVVKLPKESDDILLTTSPIEVERLFKYQYLTLLDRFQGGNKRDYNYLVNGFAGQSNTYRLNISPNRSALKNEILFSGELIVEDDYIKNITIRMDSTSRWKKSLLGATIEIAYMEVALSFKRVGGSNYLSFAKNYVNTIYTHKRSIQNNEYQSEFIVLAVNLHQQMPIEKRQRLKTKTLYKHGDNHISNFWEGINIPIYSKRETDIIEKLKAKQLLE
ncbi:MAG: carboxypeptidase-like regulatory domain-containing protein [Cyclobacteriaceae bacterium]|nr:carboxypeptidase-like regulatory domain-containing protein [Cyclobacteriaceae bacterium]